MKHSINHNLKLALKEVYKKVLIALFTRMTLLRIQKKRRMLKAIFWHTARYLLKQTKQMRVLEWQERNVLSLVSLKWIDFFFFEKT